MKYKKLEGYKHYNIYPDGTVIRRKHTSPIGRTHLSRKKLHQTKEKNGYLTVILVDDNGEKHKWYVHRLLYNVFVGKIKIGYEVDHIDGDRTNNHLDNLRMITHRENANTETAKQRYKRANARDQGKYDRLRLERARTKRAEKNAKRIYIALMMQYGQVKVTHFMREAHIGYQRAIRIMNEFKIDNK